MILFGSIGLIQAIKDRLGSDNNNAPPATSNDTEPRDDSSSSFQSRMKKIRLEEQAKVTNATEKTWWTEYT